MPTIYAGEWAPEYGGPHLTEADGPEGQAEVWEHSLLTSVDCPPLARPLAFVDGIRRVEAQLFYAEGNEEPAPGVAGALAVGAVVPSPAGPLEVVEVEVRRLAIFGSGKTASLPPQPGGWSWQTVTLEDGSLDAPMQELQRLMREREWALAERLAAAGQLVCLDGPLHSTRDLKASIVGYVKTHHRRLLEPAAHAKVALLEHGQRTSLFTVSERHSCYFRLAQRTPRHHPWFGIVRLEVSAGAGRQATVATMNAVCGTLPRYAGVSHVDPRAPQNLQPVGALERELRRRCGDTALGTRATREAVAQLAGG